LYVIALKLLSNWNKFSFFNNLLNREKKKIVLINEFGIDEKVLANSQTKQHVDNSEAIVEQRE
jgi:hypothetical protein